MIDNYSARLSGSKRNLIALLASSAVLTVGCSNMASTAPGVKPLSSPATLSGKIHGGNQQVVGATVTLWYAGQSGPATLAATTTSDSSGSFSFIKDTTNGNPADNGSTNTFSCPTGTDPLVYVESIGGNTQNNGTSQSNSAAAFIAIYDVCSQLSASNFVYMSEVTTVATMAAAAQFFEPVSHSLFADGTGQQKIIVDQLGSTVRLLANLTTGLGVVSTPSIAPAPGANVAPGVTVTATPEQGKVNLLANIISACINAATASATPCTTLFSAAVPPLSDTTLLNPGSFAPATDTLQALYYMFTNPSSSPTGQGSDGAANITTLFSLAGGVGAPYQPSAAQPTDWTIGISYSSTGSCGTPTGGTGGFINSPVDINVDASDTIWFANAQTGGNLSAISTGGMPYACVNFDAGASNAGGVLDSSKNVWFAAGTTMYRYNGNTQASLAFPVGVAPLGITADGLGNVYFTAVTSGVGSLYQLPGAAGASTAVAPVQISNTVGPNPVRLMPDFNTTSTLGNIWVSSGSTYVSQVAAGTGPGSLNGFITTAIPSGLAGSTYGLSVSFGNGVITSTIDTSSISVLVFHDNAWVTASGWPFTGTPPAGISSPTAISVDGRMSIWIPNNSTSALSELSFHGPDPLSPSTGYQKTSTFLNSGRASMVDQAGNIWVAGDGNNFITEIVGGAVPIFQPYAVGLSNGRFQTIP
jgi:hypothetical protein